jgi:hypothetical protein
MKDPAVGPNKLEVKDEDLEKILKSTTKNQFANKQ